MTAIAVFLVKALQIMLADIVLSGDNVGIIALAIKDLPEKMAKRVNLVGVAAAVLMRIFFVFIISLLFSLEWLHIKFFGGLLLLVITYNLARKDTGKRVHKIKSGNRFFIAVLTIVAADLSMSLDNVLAIASVAANGSKSGIFDTQQMGLIIFGLVFCIPIIFFGSKLVAGLMKKYPLIIYICSAVLANTAFNMIFEDNLLAKYTGNLGEKIAIISVVLIMIYGIIEIYFKTDKLKERI